MPHPRPSPLWFRIGSLLALVIAFVIGLLSFLNYANFRKTSQGLIETRYLVLGKDARQAVDDGVSLGLAPAQNSQLKPLFQHLRQQWPALQFAGVVDASGAVQIGDGQAATLDLTSWQKQMADSPAEGAWHARGEHHHAVGLNLIDTFGGRGGAVVLHFDDRELSAASAPLARQLLQRAALILLLFMVLTCLGVRWLVRQLATEIDQAEQLLNQPGTPATLASAAPGGLLQQTHEFVAASERARQTLAGRQS
ncbi:hypothetical protein [Chitinimonas sp.]|uniref:hypothetical protein n=1 Tax=Chitinimonas sp. TaxID=1934313 RepID=UPI0035B42FE7